MFLGQFKQRAQVATYNNLAGRLVRRDKTAHWEAPTKQVEGAFRGHKQHNAYAHLGTLGA